MPEAEGATDYLSRLMVPELVDGLMTQLVDQRPKDPRPFLGALLHGAQPPQEGSGSGVELFMVKVSMNCLGPWILLRLSGVEHQVIDVNVQAGDTKKVSFVAMNPMHQVPTLRDGSFPVFESNAIMRYLCNKFVAARQYYPADYEARAKCDMVLDWRQTVLYPHIKNVAYPVLGFAPGDADREAASADALTRDADGCFKVLSDHFLHGRNFVCGAELTIADMSVVPALSMLSVCPHIEIPAAVTSYMVRFNEATEGCFEDCLGSWHKFVEGIKK
eukprot:TRINITY_DN15365_c0_g1_i1.p1 TRINITY_DN15365_c0_g1~~TRINITY_DN15365_c0_g1_i1.p1  ORF type:complete len:274 (+),score=88.71 TRINITY_DN15365_c0_g1_i1:57-878(+)